MTPSELAARVLVHAVPRRLSGPATGHPESMTTELPDLDEEWLAATDFELWPRQGRSKGWIAVVVGRLSAPGRT